jgi:hypothetical protein
MKMSVRSIEPRDEVGKAFVHISLWDENGPPHNGAEIQVFVDHTDSYSEIRKRAVRKAKEFLKEVLESEDVETAITD